MLLYRVGYNNTVMFELARRTCGRWFGHVTVSAQHSHLCTVF